MSVGLDDALAGEQVHVIGSFRPGRPDAWTRWRHEVGTIIVTERKEHYISIFILILSVIVTKLHPPVRRGWIRTVDKEGMVIILEEASFSIIFEVL